MTAQLCGAKTRSGGSCRRPAGWGTDHPGYGRCKLHGGATPSGRKAAQREQARQAVELYGLPVETDPHQALLDEVQRTAGHVEWLGQIVRGLEERQLTRGVTKTVEHADGTRVVEARAAVNVWLKLYQDERDRLVRVAKAAIDAGVAERQVRLAEAQAQRIAQTVSAILRDLGHDLNDPRVRDVVRARLIEGTAAERPPAELPAAA